MLFFLHIPKGGGTTLNSVLDNNFQLEEFYQSYNLINKFEKQDDFIHTFNHLPNQRKNQIKVIRSHFYFGIHHSLNIPEFTYIGLLREPVDRFISDYYFILENESHILQDQVKGMEFQEYLNSSAVQFSGNLQTRMIAGQQQPKCDQQDFETAKANIINHFSMVGILERFDEMLVLLNQKKILKDICYVKQNITPQRPAKNELSQPTIKAIEQINQWDIQLYQWVQNRFTEEITNLGNQFPKELQQFLNRNKINVNPQFDLGYRYFRKGQWEKSRENLENLLQSSTSSNNNLEITARANFYLGEIYRQQNNKNADYYYRKSLETILKQKMTGTNNTYMIGSLYQRLGENSKAIEWFEKITQNFLQGTIMGNAFFHLGEIQLKAGNTGEAFDLFKKTVMHNHVHKKALYYLETLGKQQRKS